MSTVNLGGQAITFAYQQDATDEEFSQINRDIVKPGFYRGGALTHVGNVLTLTPFTVYINDKVDSKIGASIRTSVNVVKEATDNTKTYYVMEYERKETAENYGNFTFKAVGELLTSDIIIGQLVFTGSTVTSVNTTNRTMGSYNITTGDAYVDNDLIVKGDVAINDLTVGGDASITGNIDITGTLEVDGVTTLPNTTESSNTTTGGVIVSGGVGIAKNVNVGGTLEVTGVSTFKSNPTIERVVGFPAIRYSGYQLRDVGPAGGLIFYDKGSYSDGWRYLECAPESTELTSKKWQNGTLLATWATGTVVGIGQRNTQLVMSFSNIVLSSTASSITVSSPDATMGCIGLRYGGAGDWFLPSKDELNLIWENIVDDGAGNNSGVGGFVNANYWSSSEQNVYDAWYQNFSDGVQGWTNGKISLLRVRAVRAF